MKTTTTFIVAALVAISPAGQCLGQVEPLGSRLVHRAVFPDGFTYVSDAVPTDSETQPIWAIFDAGFNGMSVPDQLAAFENFILTNPTSPWTPSLEANLGTFYRNRGRYTLALQHWESAWTAVKTLKSAGAKTVGDYVLGNWTELLARLGQAEKLKAMLEETQGRPLDAGPWRVRYDSSEEALAHMLQAPRASYRCGIVALNVVADRLQAPTVNVGLKSEPAGDQGVSLADLAALAARYKMSFVAVELPVGADPVVPSVVHYSLGHFGALLQRSGNRYLVSDAVTRLPHWIGKQSIQAESSGHYLIPASANNSIFRGLSLDEQKQIVGRGYPTTISDTDDMFQPMDVSLGLPSWRISEPYLNLWLAAAIVRYPLPAGLSAICDVTYKQRNTHSIANAFNFGPSWECSWLSYVDYTDEYDEINSHPPTSYVYDLFFGDIYMPSSGVNLYSVDANGNGNSYYNFTKLAQQRTQITISPNLEQNAKTAFNVTLVNGTLLFYNQDQYFSLGNHRTYVSSLNDPQGRTSTFTYYLTNGVMCLSSVTDFAGRSSTLYYSGNSVDKVTSIVDPFNHTNTFTYNGSGQLTNTANPAAINASFTYDSNGSITNLGTPYGQTVFAYTVNTNTGNVVSRSMKVTEASGATHLYVYRNQATYLNSTSSVPLVPSSYGSGLVPSTGTLTNTFANSAMDGANSFYWSPHRYAKLSASFLSSGTFDALSTNDYALGRLRHYLLQADGVTLSGTLALQQDPTPDGVAAGQMTWFDYWGKPSAGIVGSSALPRFVAFVLPDGTTRYTYKAYNTLGNPTNEIGTWGVSPGQVLTRTNSFVYATNLVDLIAVYNTAGELISSNVYNGIHQVTTNYNALGEKTVNFYQSSSPFLLTGSVAPNGRASTNYYFTSGFLNYLQSKAVPALNFTNSYTYNSGLIATFTDERGTSITNTYDSLQRITKTARPDGTATFTYSNVSLVQTVDRLNDTNTFGYDSFGRKIWSADPLGRTNWVAYSSAGDVAYTTNALGQVSTFVYDNLGQVLSVLNPNGRGMTNSFNSLGQIFSTTDTVGSRLTNYYNNQGLLVGVSNAFGLVKYVQCDVRDHTTNVIDKTGVSVSTSYDVLGRATSQKYPDGSAILYGYSANIAGATSSTNQLGKITKFGYDLAGRVTSTTNANNEVVNQTYGVSGELLSMVDPKNHTTSWGYDLYGRQTSRTNANNVQILAFQYDPLGRLTNRWSAAHGNTTYTYDRAGNLLNITNTHSSPVIFQYDALNRVTNRTDAAGSLAYRFNNVGQLASEGGLWSDDVVTYSYSNDLLLQSFSLAQPNSSSWSEAYGYDAADRVQSIASPAGSFAYQYDTGLNGYSSDSSLIRKITLPNGAMVTNYFDVVGRCLSTKLLKSNGSVADNHTYIYDPAGQVTNVVRFDASTITYQYDPIGQLTSAKASDPGSVPRLHEQLSYVYDAAHNLSSKTNNSLAQIFGVDSLNQLSSLSWNGTLTVAGTTTSTATNVQVNGVNGNLYADCSFAKDGYTVSTGPNSFTAIAKDALGRISSNSVTANIAASTGYSYDLNGNLLSDGQYGYDYDDSDQVIRITATNAWKSEFVYDALGQRRVRTEYTWQAGNWATVSVVRYIYASGLVVQERDGNNLPLISYTRGLDGGGGIGGLLARTDHAAQSHGYYHADVFGNITTILNASQFVLARYLYDPYGNTITASGSLAQANTYRYSSKEVHIPSGLIYFGFRFYSPNLQRWLNADPIGEAGGLNLFCYAGNSPGNLRDSWGHGAWHPQLSEGEGGGWSASLYGGLYSGHTGFGIIQGVDMDYLGDISFLFDGSYVPRNNTGSQIKQSGSTQDARTGRDQQNNNNSGVSNQESTATHQGSGPSTDQTSAPSSGQYVAPQVGVNAPVSLSLELGTIEPQQTTPACFIGPPSTDDHPFATDGLTLGSNLAPEDRQRMAEFNASLITSFLGLPEVKAADTVAAADTGLFKAIGSTGKIGEKWLAENLGGEPQAYFSTGQGARYVDQFANGIANESKVGYTSLTPSVQLQISKDVELIQTEQIQGATWHFFQSPVTGLGGPSQPLLNTLQQNGINVIIH